MARTSVVFFAIIFMSTLAMGQTIGLKFGTLYESNNYEFITQRMEVSFTHPIMHDVDVTIATGVLSALGRSNSGYALPLAGGIKYMFMENLFAPYCGLEYCGILNVRRNDHSRFSSGIKLGLGIQYPLSERMFLDASTKYVTDDYSGYEVMAGVRFRL